MYQSALPPACLFPAGSAPTATSSGVFSLTGGHFPYFHGTSAVFLPVSPDLRHPIAGQQAKPAIYACPFCSL
ncbi:hypothetical protein [Xenorhabdus entomophaga]|uniref:hypothetical protein n=1 Tax=Xenorhabdus entomophaga TaxID=3136257 RepID=UPI0030F46E48